jgi:hypothetical protein
MILQRRLSPLVPSSPLNLFSLNSRLRRMTRRAAGDLRETIAHLNRIAICSQRLMRLPSVDTAGEFWCCGKVSCHYHIES